MHDILAAGGLFEAFGAAVGHNFALVDDDDAVAGGFGFAEDMG